MHEPTRKPSRPGRWLLGAEPQGGDLIWSRALTGFWHLQLLRAGWGKRSICKGTPKMCVRVWRRSLSGKGVTRAPQNIWVYHDSHSPHLNILLLYFQFWVFFFLFVPLYILCPTQLASQHTACLQSGLIREQHLQVLLVWEAGGWSWLPALPHTGLLDSPTHRLCSALYIRVGGFCSQAFHVIAW